jgi:hypothetical protein
MIKADQVLIDILQLQDRKRSFKMLMEHNL